MIVVAILAVMMSKESFNRLAIQQVTIITCFAHGELPFKKARDSRTDCLTGSKRIEKKGNVREFPKKAKILSLSLTKFQLKIPQRK